MTLRGRRFSLDSSVSLDGGLGGRRSSSWFSNKKSRHSLEDARLEIQALNHSLNSNITLRKQPIVEENAVQSDGRINNNSFKKHNKTFHKLFQEIPEEENLTHTFTCALQKEVLYHGRLFVSENHVCFHSSVLLKDTKVVVPASSVMEVKKHNSALSMLSIQTVEGEKYSFVSLRNRETCYKLLQTVCSQAQGESTNSSPENEADQDVASSYSSLEDCNEGDVSNKNSIYLDNNCPQLSSEGPTRCNSIRHSSLTDEDDRAVSWMWRFVERATPLFILREMRNLSVLFCFFIVLMVLLLMASGYIGLRIVALEEQLETLGAMTERYQES